MREPSHLGLVLHLLGRIGPLWEAQDEPKAGKPAARHPGRRRESRIRAFVAQQAALEERRDHVSAPSGRARHLAYRAAAQRKAARR